MRSHSLPVPPRRRIQFPLARRPPELDWFWWGIRASGTDRSARRPAAAPAVGQHLGAQLVMRGALVPDGIDPQQLQHLLSLGTVAPVEMPP
jgi:hypothetical protein